MWYATTTTGPPASEPVTLAQAKTQLGITGSAQDAQVTALIGAARAQVENYCNIRLVQQTVVMKCDCFADMARLPLGPVLSVASIGYVDTAGNDATVNSDRYDTRLEGLAPSIVPVFGAIWPAIQLGSRITLTADVGYETVPADLTFAVLLAIGKQYRFAGAGDVKTETVDGVGSVSYGSVAESHGVVDTAMQALLEPYRNWALADQG